MTARRTTKTLLVALGAYIVATQVFAWVYAEPTESDQDKLRKFGLIDQMSLAVGAETARLPVPPSSHKSKGFRFRTWNLV